MARLLAIHYIELAVDRTADNIHELPQCEQRGDMHAWLTERQRRARRRVHHPAGERGDAAVGKLEVDVQLPVAHPASPHSNDASEKRVKPIVDGYGRRFASRMCGYRRTSGVRWWFRPCPP